MCSVNIPKILSVIYHLLLFTTAGNVKISNGSKAVEPVWACEASLHCWTNRRKFHSPQTQLTLQRILPFRLSVGDMVYDDSCEYFMDPCKRNCFAEIWVDSSLNLKITHWDLRYNAYQHPCDLMATKRAMKNAALRKLYTNNPNVPQCCSNQPSICRQHIVQQFLFSNALEFGEILIKMQPFWLKKMHSKMLSAKWRPFCHSHISVIIFCISSEIRLNAIRYP